MEIDSQKHRPKPTWDEKTWVHSGWQGLQNEKHLFLLLSFCCHFCCPKNLQISTLNLKLKLSFDKEILKTLMFEKGGNCLEFIYSFYIVQSIKLGSWNQFWLVCSLNSWFFMQLLTLWGKTILVTPQAQFWPLWLSKFWVLYAAIDTLRGNHLQQMAVKFFALMLCSLHI